MNDIKCYVGMNFKKWCDLDPDDERMIHYKLHTKEKEVEEFTSEDYKDWSYLSTLRKSKIKNIELINDEWYIELI